MSAGRPGRRGQPRTAALPPLRPTVRAGRTDDAPPLDAALGGDLLLAGKTFRHCFSYGFPIFWVQLPFLLPLPFFPVSVIVALNQSILFLTALIFL